MRKWASFLGLIAIVILVTSCGIRHGNSHYIFNAEQIKDHPDTAEVKQMMDAAPDSSFYRLYFGKLRFIQLYYAQDSAEFRFKDGRLLEVIVNKPSLDYKPQSITRFGLPFKEPNSQDSTAFFMWKNLYEGFDAVNFYLVGSKKDQRDINYKIYFKLSPENINPAE